MSIYRNGEELGSRNFDEYLRNYLPATNPNLATLFGVETDVAISFLRDLKGFFQMIKLIFIILGDILGHQMHSLDTDFSSKCRAPYFRRKQNEDLSMSVAKRGVDKIREGENAGAVQHFNRALSICEKNIEALVGRAAAYVVLIYFKYFHFISINIILRIEILPFQKYLRFQF